MKKKLERATQGVLVTGASTGLGNATALHLARIGFRVFAGVRRREDARALLSMGVPRLEPVELDVTDEATIARAATAIAGALGDGGELFAVVNNAGTCVSAPLECVGIERLRHQLEVNVVGQVAVLQALLPMLRESGGRIVNISSGMGKVAVPYFGPYVTAEFAKEGMSDALRRELRPLGVAVVLVEPGAVATPLWDKLARDAEAELGRAPGGARRVLLDESREGSLVEAARASASFTGPEDVARTVARALTARRPSPRYTVGPDSLALSLASRVVPDAAFDALFSLFTRS